MSVKRWKLGWKRCDCVKCEAALTIEETQENCGWVMWEHHKAEVERLEQQIKYWRIEAETDHARWLRVLEDVERLRKAGDAMAETILKDCIHKNDIAALKWYDAKEGKQP